SSARPTTCTASSSRGTRICGASISTRSFRATRCARTIRRRSASRSSAAGRSRPSRRIGSRRGKSNAMDAGRTEPPLTDDLHTQPMEIQMGPSHPSTHGTVKITLQLDGERILDSKVEVGYLHRGFEKECESGEWYQAIPYTDRLNYASPMINNVGYCLAAEKLFGIAAPPRAQYLRTIACELSRMADHFTCIGASALELAALTPFLYCVQAREQIWDLHESLCGARVTTNYVRIGGLQSDLQPGFAELCRSKVAHALDLFADVDNLLTQNPIFRERMEGTGALPAATLIA